MVSTMRSVKTVLTTGYIYKRVCLPKFTFSPSRLGEGGQFDTTTPPRSAGLRGKGGGANAPHFESRGAKTGLAPSNISEKFDKKGDFFAAPSAPWENFSEKSLFSEILPPPNNFPQLRLWGASHALHPTFFSCKKIEYDDQGSNSFIPPRGGGDFGRSVTTFSAPKSPKNGNF